MSKPIPDVSRFGKDRICTLCISEMKDDDNILDIGLIREGFQGGIPSHLTGEKDDILNMTLKEILVLGGGM